MQTVSPPTACFSPDSMSSVITRDWCARVHKTRRCSIRRVDELQFGRGEEKGETAREERIASDREDRAGREHGEGEGNVASRITERDLHQLQEYRHSWREKNNILQGRRHFILCVPRQVDRKCITSFGNLRNVKIGNVSVQNFLELCLKIRLFFWISEGVYDSALA